MSWSLAAVLATIWLGPPFLAAATWVVTRSWRRAAINAAMTLGALTGVILVSRRPLEIAQPAEIALIAITFLPALLLTGLVIVIVRTVSAGDPLH
ncbi:MAG: hypothetical protein R3B97_17230 [Dehalococcoidia bacterium]|nr:hypothetical protein [Dehalococcoidia bacterium]MCA9829529.1 hypothetical protein [Dehalococcoidia bacterium]